VVLSPWGTWKWTRGNVMAAQVCGKFIARCLASCVSVEHMIGWTTNCGQRLLSWIQNVRRRGMTPPFLVRCYSCATTLSWVTSTSFSYSAMALCLIFLGAGIKLWGKKPGLASLCLCPSVRQHGTTRIALDGFSWNLIFEYLYKLFEKIQICLML
jgi:hypothetical protein